MKLRYVFATSAIAISVTFAQPADSDYQTDLGQAKAALAAGDYVRALKASQHAIQSDVSRWEAYVISASAYRAQGLYDDAVGMLQMALPRAPEDRKPQIRDAITEIRRAVSQARQDRTNLPLLIQRHLHRLNWFSGKL